MNRRCEFRIPWPNFCNFNPAPSRAVDFCVTHRMMRWADRMVAILQSGEGDPFAVHPSEPYVSSTCARGPS